MPRSRRPFLPAFLVWLLALSVAADVFAHAERPVESPPRPGPVPNLARVNPNTLVVCKPNSKPTAAQLAEIQLRLATETGEALLQAQRDEAAWHRNTTLFDQCCFEHIQDAVNAALDDTDILIMPGVYLEEGSRACPETSTGDNADGSYSYEYQSANPHDQNLIAIIGKTNITLEGTGGKPEDVLIDGGFAKDVAIRCDRCTGIIFRNLWARDVNEHAIYVIDSDGYIFDRTRGSYAREYELFSFASDNGLYTDCEAEGGSDSGLYIGGQPITPGRFSAEVRRCKMHHNALGFSGTQGSYVWMHDNDFYDNAIGISYDSETDHPNFPQRFSLIENNLIHDNNLEIYDADSDVPPGGPGYGFFRYPVGTGMWIVGGEDNIVRNNFFYGNKRMGMILARNPLEVPTPEEPGLSQVNRNQIYGNIIGVDPDGNPAPNLTAFPPGGDYAEGGSDLWWDETGINNCWGPQDPVSGPIETDPPNALYPLGLPGPCPGLPNAGVGSALKLEILANCAMDSSTPPHTMDVTYPCPWGQVNNAPYQNKNERECGNWIVDLGEQCDPGYDSLYGPNLDGESCESLGHGTGTLACKPDCTFDFAACEIGGPTCGAANPCGSYNVKRLKISGLAAPAGDEKLVLKGFDLNGAGRVFDPRSENVEVTVRDEDGVVHSALIPAGNPNWRARPLSGPIKKYTYTDKTGTYGGMRKIVLRSSTAALLGGAFRALVKIRNADLSGASGADVVTVNVRVGDDCWAQGSQCVYGASGKTAKCATPVRSCLAP